MLIRVRNKIWLMCCLLLYGAVNVLAAPIPKSKNVHIELIYDLEPKTNAMGVVSYFTAVPFSYFNYTNIYSSEERKIGSELYGDKSTALDFELNHPLYGEIIPGSTSRIPFYVEPGDTLLVYVTKVGKLIGYAAKDGGVVKCANMLMHDISNSTFYTAQDFETDRRGADFNLFLSRIKRKMATAVESVNAVADRYGFTEKERRIAVNNAMMQFACWIFEYAPYKSFEIGHYSQKNEGGWQTLPEQDRDAESVSNVANYSFVNDLPLNDSTCMASRYFPMFIQSYEHSHILNCDQYLYYGTTKADEARMDSAFVAREQLITGRMMPSLFMDIAMQRKHYEPLPDDGSIRLREVNVMGSRRSFEGFKGITEEEMYQARLNSKTSYNALSPSYWFGGRKREKTRARVRALIKRMEEEEQRERDEHDAIMKAYEQTMKEKGEQ